MATAAQVTQAYFDVLGRPPDPAGLAYYTTGEGAAKGIDQIRADFNYAVDTGAENKAANVEATQAVTQAYEQILGRPPDPEGLSFYVTQVVSREADPTQVAAVLADSPEGRATPATAATQTNVTRDDVISAYENTLGRKPESEEVISFYTNPANLSTGAGLTGLPALQALLADSPEGRAAAAKAAETAAANVEGRPSVLDKDGKVISTPSDRAPGGVYQPTYTPYRQQAQVTQAYRDILGRSPDPTGLAYYTTGEGADRGIDQIRRDFQYAVDTGIENPVFSDLQDGPFGGYYAQPGISPYGGVFGFGTEQFEQQSDPFSGAQARARSLISNRLTPLTDNVPIDARQPGAFGGDMAANGVPPSPFAYRQTLSPTTLAALAAEATPGAAASEVSGRQGGYVDQGITAIRR